MMKIYKVGDSSNVVGPKVRELRKKNKLSQEALAKRLQLDGYEFSDLMILRIEKGTRFVPDYEVKALAKALGVSYEELLGE